MPALHINGGTASREDAQRECLDAIAFAREGDPGGYDSDAQTIALEVSVAPAACPRGHPAGAGRARLAR